MKKLIPLILLLSFSIKAQEIKIGTQIWTTKNLDVTTYRNGDAIPEVQDAKERANLNTGAWYYYENDKANGTKYGKRYNWYAVNDPRGLAPKGYHIPTDKEWTILTKYLGGSSVAGTKMKSSSGWRLNGNGTNSSGFEGLPGGYQFNFERWNIDAIGIWWSSSENGYYYAWARNMSYDHGRVDFSNSNKQYGFSVRCLKD
jgi:uncharacterized protein (TIGR02145 family)